MGVKYCFRYNARNRALRNGEEVDQVNMENIPTRPHRRRKEKKLMTMDEVNERFPLTKYKNWVANRMSAGLPTAGGVTAPSSRAGSLRNVDGVVPSSPVETKHSVNLTRPASAASETEVVPVKPIEHNNEQVVKDIVVKDSTESSPPVAIPVPDTKHHTSTSLDEDDDEDDHIHTAVPPELLTNPGDSCAICIDTLEDDDDIRGLTCGHAFHAGCLDPWLTSRRACCPLCKADYFTPKPRPEGEQIDLSDRAARRRDARGNVPQEPRSAWAGFRGAARNVLPGRYESRNDGAGEAHDPEDRNARRDQRTVMEAHGEPVRDSRGNNNTSESAPAASATAPTSSRFGNPFSSMRMPAIPRLAGRSRTAGQPAVAEPSPSQLEAGTIPAR